MYYNSHIHVFRDVDIPRRFLPLGLVRILASKPGFYITAKVLNNLNPFSDKDLFDRYIKFVRIGKMGTQKKIFENCMRFYPNNTQFIILTMDMAFMGAGKVPRNFEEQVIELGKLKKQYSQIHPFIHIDPRRKGYIELLKRSYEDYGIEGVKLYPPLGYFPFDPKLYPVYEFCESNNIPVLAHCSPYNPVHFKGKKDQLLKLLKQGIPNLEYKGKTRKQLCSLFTHPKNYVRILDQFKNLRICLAHFGSEYYWDEYMSNPGNADNWFVIIKDMLEKYTNLYSDISFTLNNQQFFPLLKVLLNNDAVKSQILFGSDYYMVETKVSERRFCIDLRAYLGEEMFDQIAIKNPRKFLGVH